MTKALETGALAVFSLSFLAVGREGFETALFMVGYAEAETAWPLLGLFIGVLVAAVIAWGGMYAGAVRINLAKFFFSYTGVFLILVAAGVLSYGVGALQTVGWVPGSVTGPSTSAAPSTGRPGTARSSRASSMSPPHPPTVLQLICWLAYIVVVLALFLRPTRPPAPKPAPATDVSPENADASEESERSPPLTERSHQ